MTRNTTFCLYFLKEILLAHFQSFFGRSNRDAFLENEAKIHEGEYVKEFFFRKLAGWHLPTSLRINLITDNFQGFLSYWTPSNGCISFLHKMLKKHLWNRSFSEVLYKRGVLKNFSKVTDKHKKQSSGGVLSKDVLKYFAKFTENTFARISFLIKLQSGNLKLSEAVTGDVQ